MKNICANLVLSITMLALNVTVAHAADRVQAGQWEMTIGDGAQGTPTKRCVTVAHANVVNGDDKTFRESLIKAAEEVGCTVKDIRVSGKPSDPQYGLRRGRKHEHDDLPWRLVRAGKFQRNEG